MSQSDYVARFFESFRGPLAIYLPAIKRARAANPELFDTLGGTMLGWAEDALGAACMPTLAESYASFVTNVNRSQARYEKTGRYENSSYEEVYRTVYGNDEFMSKYTWGVFVTTFAWQHHLDIYRFFRDRFLPRLSEVRTVVDLGCGSGIWSLLVAAAKSTCIINGRDISPQSIEFAQRLATMAGLSNNVQFVCEDALTLPNEEAGHFDAGVSCFLAEHLSEPEKLFQNMAALIKPRGYSFMTVALTAAEIDHISEFRFESEPILLAEKAGLRVVEILSSAPAPFSPAARFLPRSVAMIMQRRQGDIW